MKTSFFSLVCATALASLALLGAGGTTAAPIKGVEHVIIIGCDGMGSLAFGSNPTPNLKRLMKEGSHTLRARGVMPTSSSPNWASMIMGAGPEQHGITSNDWETNKFEIPPIGVGSGGIFPTIFGVLREQKPKSVIACVHDWDGFGRLLEPKAPDLLERVKGSPETITRAIAVFKERKPQFLFIHLDDVDHAGHSKGWKSPEYFAEVEVVDGLIGKVIKAVEEEGLSSKTVIMITADHGGKGTSHGGPTLEEIEIPWIIKGPGIKAGNEIASPVNTYDTAATVAYMFGLTQPSCWIGKPVLAAFK